MVMKKKMMMHVALSFTVLLTAFSSDQSYAMHDESHHEGQHIETHIKTKSEHVPKAVMDKVTTEYMDHVTNLDRIKGVALNRNYQLGEAFNIYKFDGQSDGMYYFPIVSDGEVNYIATVYKDAKTNAYSMRVNRFIADALNAHNGETFTILSSSDGYYIERQNKLTFIHKDGPSNQEMGIQREQALKHENVNRFTRTLNHTTTPTHTITAQRNTRFYIGNQRQNYLKNFKVRERQSSLPWCVAYSTAALLNATLNTDQYSAYGVMKGVNPNVPDDQLKGMAMYESQAMDYVRSQGRHPVYVDRPVSYDEVNQAVDKNEGVFIVVYAAQNPNARHAMAMIGTMASDNGQYMVYWNPWDSDVSSQDANSAQMNLRGSAYIWQLSIVGF